MGAACSRIRSGRCGLFNDFLSHYRSRKLLFLHGGRDKRIPRQFVTNAAAFLRRSGCDVRIRIYENEDHSLVLSQRGSVADEIAAFMAEP